MHDAYAQYYFQAIGIDIAGYAEQERDVKYHHVKHLSLINRLLADDPRERKVMGALEDGGHLNHSGDRGSFPCCGSDSEEMASDLAEVMPDPPTSEEVDKIIESYEDLAIGFVSEHYRRMKRALRRWEDAAIYPEEDLYCFQTKRYRLRMQGAEPFWQDLQPEPREAYLAVRAAHASDHQHGSLRFSLERRNDDEEDWEELAHHYGDFSGNASDWRAYRHEAFAELLSEAKLDRCDRHPERAKPTGKRSNVVPHKAAETAPHRRAANESARLLQMHEYARWDEDSDAIAEITLSLCSDPAHHGLSVTETESVGGQYTTLKHLKDGRNVAEARKAFKAAKEALLVKAGVEHIRQERNFDMGAENLAHCVHYAIIACDAELEALETLAAAYDDEPVLFYAAGDALAYCAPKSLGVRIIAPGKAPIAVRSIEQAMSHDVMKAHAQTPLAVLWSCTSEQLEALERALAEHHSERLQVQAAVMVEAMGEARGAAQMFG